MLNKLYAGVVAATLAFLLIFYIKYLHAELENVNNQLNVKTEQINIMTQRIEDLNDSVKRKEGALLAYMTIESKVQKVSSTAINMIKTYKLRVTENEKCLDYTPPESLINGLRKNSVYR